MKVDWIKLKKMRNTRDLGGMRTADGRVIATGKLIRSGKLSKLPPKTVLALRGRVQTVVDLRIESERSADPDVIIEGSRYIHLPVLCVPTMGITSGYEQMIFPKESARVKKEGERIKREFGTIDNYMKETYRSIVFADEGKAGLKRFLRLVIEEEGCILWHCAGGKDRAGICAMLVEALLGVNEEDILEDYIASGKYWRKQYFFNRVAIVAVPFSIDLKRMLFGLMRTKREYLQTVIDEMRSRYGGIVGYCKTCLDVTDEDIALMRAKYLEKP